MQEQKIQVNIVKTYTFASKENCDRRTVAPGADIVAAAGTKREI